MIATVSADTAVWASHYNQLVNALNQALGDRNFADVTALKALDMTDIAYTTFAFVHGVGLYRWISGSTLTGDDLNVVQPTVGTGRWKLETGKAFARELTTIAQLKAINTTGITYEQLALVTYAGIYRFDPTSALIADGLVVVKPTTGTGRWLLLVPSADTLLAMLHTDLTDILGRLGPVYEGSLYYRGPITTWASIAAGAVGSATVPLPGTRPGDPVILGLPPLDSNFTLAWYEPIADGVVISQRNNSGGALTPSTTALWTLEVRRLSL